MRITSEISNINFNKLDSFIYNNPHTNFFQSVNAFQFFSNVENFEPLLFVATDSDEVVGSLLSVVMREGKGIKGYLSRRCIVWGGPLIKDDNSDVLELILKAYTKEIKGEAIYSQFRNLWQWTNKQKEIFKKNGYDYEAHLDILIDLNNSADDLLMKMHKGRRKNIRRAERLPLEFSEIEKTSDLEKSLYLIEHTYKKVKLPCPDKSFFISANEIFSKNGRLKMFVAKYKDEVIACRFVLCYKTLIYDWYAGANDKHLDKYPNDFLPWKVMEWGIDNGYKIFDFGGAGKPNVPYGVRDHKIKFGGSLKEFGRFTKVSNKSLYKIGELGMKILKMIR